MAVAWLGRRACAISRSRVPGPEHYTPACTSPAYRPVLNAFKAAINHGIDVRICYHDTPANRDAIDTARAPREVRRPARALPAHPSKDPSRRDPGGPLHQAASRSRSGSDRPQPSRHPDSRQADTSPPDRRREAEQATTSTTGIYDLPKIRSAKPARARPRRRSRRTVPPASYREDSITPCSRRARRAAVPVVRDRMLNASNSVMFAGGLRREQEVRPAVGTGPRSCASC